MKSILSVIVIVLLCAACGKTPVQKANRIDKDITIELAVRMEVNGQIEDSHKANFSMVKGTVVPGDLILTSDGDVSMIFSNFRLEDGKAAFDSWGFDGFSNLSSKSGTKGSAWPYKAQQADGFSIPIDGSKKLDELLTWYDKTAINGELMKAYVTLDIRTN